MSDNFLKVYNGLAINPRSSDPANPVEGDLYFSDGTARPSGLWQYKSGAWEDVGASGAGGINYIDNDNAESDTTGWAEYADAAATVPVDGTGGSTSTVTFSRNTSSPLRGVADFDIAKSASNGQGEGVSYDFTIDSADQAKKLTLKFDYTTGTNYADDDIKLFIYDVTNSNLIRINGEDLKATSGNATHYARFQTAPDSTSYRLILHVSSTNSSAYTVNFDNVSVGPTNLSFGAIVTDMESYSPTISQATVTGSTAFYKRVGDSLYVQGRFFVTTGGSGVLTIPLPPGLSIDSNKVANASQSSVGDGFWVDSGTGFFSLSARTDTSTTIAFYQDGAGASFNGSSLAANDIISYNFEVPIVGWSSNAQMSEDLGGREIKVYANGNNGGGVTAGTTAFNWNTVITDTTGSWTGPSGNEETFTAPETGRYRFNGSIRITAASSSEIRAYKNGTNFQFVASFGGKVTKAFSYTVDLVKGDTIDFRPDITVTQNNVSADHWITISKESNPQTILETERETLKATYDSGATVSAGSPIIFNNVVFRDSGSYSSSTGVYTASKTGRYRGSVKVKPSASSTVEIGIEVNGTEVDVVEAGTTANSVVVPFQVDLSKDDTLEITNSAGTTLTLTSTASNNTLELERIK